ncbi:MAG: hypothetical protein GY930_22680 [bacterium]|nr:hypothetical protein [bacterium]
MNYPELLPNRPYGTEFRSFGQVVRNVEVKSSQCAVILSLATLPFLSCCEAHRLQSGAMPATDVQHWSNSHDRVPVAIPTTGEVEGVPNYGTPFQLPGHRTWISSLVISKTSSFFRDSVAYSEGGLAGSSVASADANKDGKFANDEPVHSYFLDQSMNSPVAKPWHSDGFRQDLERWYH